MAWDAERAQEEREAEMNDRTRDWLAEQEQERVTDDQPIDEEDYTF